MKEIRPQVKDFRVVERIERRAGNAILFLEQLVSYCRERCPVFEDKMLASTLNPSLFDFNATLTSIFQKWPPNQINCLYFTVNTFNISGADIGISLTGGTVQPKSKNDRIQISYMPPAPYIYTPLLSKVKKLACQTPQCQTFLDYTLVLGAATLHVKFSEACRAIPVTAVYVGFSGGDAILITNKSDPSQ